MAVINCYGNSGFVARLVSDNDCLCSISRIQCKLIIAVKSNLFAVHCHGVDIFLRDRNGLCRTIGLAVFNTGDNGNSCVKHHAICIDICYVSACIGQSGINYILVIGIDTKRRAVFREGHFFQLVFGKLLFAQQIFDCNRFAAVVIGSNCYRLRILEEQSEGNIIEESFPTVFSNLDFVCRRCRVSYGNGKGYICKITCVVRFIIAVILLTEHIKSICALRKVARYRKLNGSACFRVHGDIFQPAIILCAIAILDDGGNIFVCTCRRPGIVKSNSATGSACSGRFRYGKAAAVVL